MSLLSYCLLLQYVVILMRAIIINTVADAYCQWQCHDLLLNCQVQLVTNLSYWFFLLFVDFLLSIGPYLIVKKTNCLFPITGQMTQNKYKKQSTACFNLLVVAFKYSISVDSINMSTVGGKNKSFYCHWTKKLRLNYLFNGHSIKTLVVKSSLKVNEQFINWK